MTKQTKQGYENRLRHLHGALTWSLICIDRHRFGTPDNPELSLKADGTPWDHLGEAVARMEQGLKSEIDHGARINIWQYHSNFDDDNWEPGIRGDGPLVASMMG